MKFLLISFIMFLLTVAGALACTVPITDLVVSGDEIACNGTFIASNIKLGGGASFTANDTIINGNGSIVFTNEFGSSSHLKIDGFVVFNATKLMQKNSPSTNLTIINNVVNSTIMGVDMRGGSSHFVDNNVFNGPLNDFGGSTEGILIQSAISENNTITNNIVRGYDYGIRLRAFVNFSLVDGNQIFNSGTWGISALGARCNITNNQLYNGSWNLIHIAGDNHIVENNFGDAWGHMFIDAHSETQDVALYNSVINQNNGTHTNTDYPGADYGIIIEFAQNTNITNNFLYNLVGNDSLNCIGVEGHNEATGNRILNNFCENGTGYAFVDGGVSNTFQDNIIINFNDPSGFEVYTSGFFDNATAYSQSQFINNTGLLNYTLNARHNGTIEQPYSYDITNNAVGSVPIRLTLLSPFDDVYNLSNSSFLVFNASAYSALMGASQQVSVRAFVEPTPPTPDVEGADLEIASVLSFGLVIAFFLYLGNRLRLIPVDESRSSNSDLLIKVGEVFTYSFAGLLIVILMFLTMEFTSGETYAGVIRTVFIVLQIILGLISGLGAFVGGLTLVVIAVSRILTGKGDEKKRKS